MDYHICQAQEGGISVHQLLHGYCGHDSLGGRVLVLKSSRDF